MNTAGHGNNLDLFGHMRQGTVAQPKRPIARWKGLKINAIMTDTLRAFIDKNAQWEYESLTLIRAGYKHKRHLVLRSQIKLGEWVYE